MKEGVPHPKTDKKNVEKRGGDRPGELVAEKVSGRIDPGI
jgi:hypothetical protein